MDDRICESNRVKPTPSCCFNIRYANDADKILAYSNFDISVEEYVIELLWSKIICDSKLVSSSYSFTKYLSAKWGKDKVRVNCVSPGGVFDKSESKIFNKKYSKSVPIGRKAYPTEIPGTVLFLASEASSYITGQNIIIDGGKTII